MSIDWADVQKQLKPIPNYEDLTKRLNESVSYCFVQRLYNFNMAQAAEYITHLLEEDTKQRYGEGAAALKATFRKLDEKGVPDIFELVKRVDSRDKLEAFIAVTGLPVSEVIAVLVYLLKWVLPGKKMLRELVEETPLLLEQIAALRQCGVRSSLDILEQCATPEGRKAVSQASGVPEDVILDLTNRSDFTRMPYTRGASACNYVNAGYASLDKLANADLDTLFADFDRYGESIGKNLKIGMEVDNGKRVAMVIPKVVQG